MLRSIPNAGSLDREWVRMVTFYAIPAEHWRLKAPELMKDVHLGAVYRDGIVIEPMQEKVAA